MLEYWWLMVLILLGALDFVSVVARLEIYNDLKYISDDQINEIPLGLYSKICFYLIPDPEADIIKFTKKFPMTYFFDRKIKKMLKDKTYEREPVMDRLNALAMIKLKNIKERAVFAVLPKADRDEIMKRILSEGK